MNIYGQRFAEVGLFVGYCEDLNVKTNEQEMEYYERTGVMLPVARVVYPDEIIIHLERHQQDGDYGWNGFDEWPDLASLVEKFSPSPRTNTVLNDEDLVHRFDRALDSGGHPYLSVPEAGNFTSWRDYEAQVSDADGHTFGRPTADHYYSHWQVHQLYLIQQHPHLYRYAGLIDRLPPDEPFKAFVRADSETVWFREFDGMRTCFDALSFWITLYGRERSRSIPGMNDQRAIQARLAEWAALTTKRHKLTDDGLFQFLRQLIRLYEDYVCDERHKLARELRKDILHCGRLIELATGRTWEQVADRLGQSDQFDKRTFRHLLAANRERDYALEMLVNPPPAWSRTWQEHSDSDWSFTEVDANRLLDYCEQQGLPLLRTGLSGMMATGEEERAQKFTKMGSYANLRNVMTGYEDLLKQLGRSAERTKGRSPLTSTVEQVMNDRSWIRLFRDHRKLVSGGTDTEFLKNLDTLLSRRELQESAQASMAGMFLITCLARNMTAHANPNDDRFFADAFHTMRDAAITAISYTWKLAEKQGWTNPAPMRSKVPTQRDDPQP